MLVPKKLDKQKLMIYFIIIGAMISATAFLILKNMRISRQTYPVGQEEAHPDARITPTELSVPQIPAVKKDGPMKILDNPRFQALKESNFETDMKQENVGNKNPFEPSQE